MREVVVFQNNDPLLTCNLPRFVSGHDFSRAATIAEDLRALAPALFALLNRQNPQMNSPVLPARGSEQYIPDAANSSFNR